MCSKTFTHCRLWSYMDQKSGRLYVPACFQFQPQVGLILWLSSYYVDVSSNPALIQISFSVVPSTYPVFKSQRITAYFLVVHIFMNHISYKSRAELCLMAGPPFHQPLGGQTVTFGTIFFLCGRQFFLKKITIEYE